MIRSKSDVVFARVGKERRKKVARAERVTGLSLARIVCNGLDKELRALARRFPKLAEAKGNGVAKTDNGQ